MAIDIEHLLRRHVQFHTACAAARSRSRCGRGAPGKIHGFRAAVDVLWICPRRRRLPRLERRAISLTAWKSLRGDREARSITSTPMSSSISAMSSFSSKSWSRQALLASRSGVDMMTRSLSDLGRWSLEKSLW